METVLTPLSGTPVPSYKKYHNRLFMTEYCRKRRQEKGLKQRPRKTEDGRWLCEVDPSLKKRKNYYVKKTKVTCETCGKCVHEGFLSRHMSIHTKTAQH